MPLPAQALTPEEYLAIERQAEFKSEYLDGETFAMAGATYRHNLLASNVARLLGNALEGRDCVVLPSDMRIKIERSSKYTYPDFSVVCGEILFEDDHEDVLLNPTVIGEILSPSTEAYDRGKKFEHYQTIPSLREYVLVSQDSCRLELYTRRQERIWTYSEFRSTGEVARLASIACELDLAGAYAKVLTR